MEPLLLAGALVQVAVGGGELADALVDEVLVVEALAGGGLVRVLERLVGLLGGVEDAEVLGDAAHLVGDVAHLALHGVDEVGLEPTHRRVGALRHDERLHAGADQLLDLREHRRPGVGVEGVAEDRLEVGAEGAERAGERAGVLVEEVGGGAGDLVDRGGDLGLEAGLELLEGALDHVDVDAHVGGAQRPGADPEALADREGGVVGLGDHADDLVVGLVELPDVDHAVADEDPGGGEDAGLCAHGLSMRGV